ncbi:acetate/propionate family kinase [Halomonas sp. 7T]|uniref:acetate/propionate family kinase n=1 Tax=Halomonas sp. 7T TaxID=2893469 RepID=UPI0021D88F87|nr:acetate/propionate family kinase [Halomonas sp. 7T]UXZ55446.1 acetate/propionate family kinase [Halomonas sp. 7T]
MQIMVINSGSSSIKFGLYLAPNEAPLTLDALTLKVEGHFSGIGSRGREAVRLNDAQGEALSLGGLAPSATHEEALSSLMAWLEADENGSIAAIGHRVVHGGRDYQAPIKVAAEQLDALSELNSLAPLHQPHGLAPIKQLVQRYPDVAQIACFDTAFHAEQPSVARHFALPRELTQKGLIRYGFHGLSYDYISRVLDSYLPEEASKQRIIVAHLGNGASLCALQNRRSVASTMGFTALEGLPMGTRSGSVDPGLVLHLIQREGMSPEEVETMLYKRSGLLGVSDISGDVRELLESDAPEAEEALSLYAYRIAREIGSLAAALGGLDQLIFTAGVGENAAYIREQVVKQCAWLGVALDSSANALHAARISPACSKVGAWIIPTDEARMMAWYCAQFMHQRSA